MAAESLCECGCGGLAPIAPKTSRRDGWRKGQPLRFIKGHRHTARRGWIEEDRGFVTPCWIWQGYVNPHNGYGYLGSKTAHRVHYEPRFGPVPKGLQIDHLCRVRTCVNPDHLQAVTGSENTRRGAIMALITKLTPQQRYEVMVSTGATSAVAERYGITAGYVRDLRKGRRGPRWR